MVKGGRGTARAAHPLLGAKLTLSARDGRKREREIECEGWKSLGVGGGRQLVVFCSAHLFHSVNIKLSFAFHTVSDHRPIITEIFGTF